MALPRATAKPVKNICNDGNGILDLKEDFHSYMKKEYQKIFKEEWFFDKITHQRATELLIEKGRRGDFLVRVDLEDGNFFLIWKNYKNYIKYMPIAMNRKTRKWNIWTEDNKGQVGTLNFTAFSEVLQYLIANNLY